MNWLDAIMENRTNKFFIEFVRMATSRLEQQFAQYNQRIKNPEKNGFKWIKNDPRYMDSFEHLSFSLNNNIFSVVVELIDDKGNSSYNAIQKQLHSKVCSENDLIPVLFKIKLTHSNNFLKIFGIKPKMNRRLCNKKWNLYNTFGDKVNPSRMRDGGKKPMSHWELRNMAIRIVESHIIKTGGEILGIYDGHISDPKSKFPEIIFLDNNKETAYCYVEYRTEPTRMEYIYQVLTSNENVPIIREYNGFWATVALRSATTNSETEIYRGDGLFAGFKELIKIYETNKKH